MPLRDHFHSPVNDTHSWDEVHGGWPMEIVRDLRNILPPGFRAGPNVHLGSSFEVDVTTYESATAPDSAEEGGTVTQTALSPTLTVEADLSEQDEYEVRIYFHCARCSFSQGSRSAAARVEREKHWVFQSI